jgi:hypothetical protein
VDFIVGYDGLSDKAYVYSWKEVRKQKVQITVDKSHLEKWEVFEV